MADCQNKGLFLYKTNCLHTFPVWEESLVPLPAAKIMAQGRDFTDSNINKFGSRTISRVLFRYDR